MGAPFALDCLKWRPYRELHPRLLESLGRLSSWPSPERYDELARHVPRAADVELPHFVKEDREAVRRVGGYEQHVARLSAVPTRPDNWHDFFNMIVWAHFPKLRWALNALHVDPDAGPKDPRNGRAPAQNLAATFDEAGMLVLSSSRSVLKELRALRFRRAFWDMRAELLATTRFWVVGHGMLEALLQPRAGLAVRGLLMYTPAVPPPATDDQLRFHIDAIAAERARAWSRARDVLDPLPILAIPGYSDNDCAQFYDDFRNIRFEPCSRRPAATSLLTV
jgi:hypothetical protein